MMREVLLTSVCRPKQWKTIATKDLKEAGYPVYGANGKIGFNDEYTHELPTLLITCRGATCGMINICDPKSYVNGNAMALDNLSEEVDIFFLKNYLDYRRLDDVISGSAQPQITGQGLSKVKIPLPPLETQKKIAAILDAADAYRQKTKALIAKYDELTQSLFLDMFGDPVRNEKGWEVKKLSDYIKKLNTGVSVNSTDEKYSIEKACILKTSCVYSGIFRPIEAKVIREDEYGRMKLKPKADSIIISRMNTSELVGKSAFIEKDYTNLFLPDRLWQSEKSEMEHSVRWLSKAISFDSFMNEISKISSGTSGSMKNISMKTFLTLPVIYPPSELQQKYAERVQKIEEQKAQAQESLEKAEELFNSLLQRTFKGEIE